MNRFVSDNEIVELAQSLVRCPSINPSGDTSACVRIVLNKFKEEKIEAEIIEGKEGACNVVARLPGKNKGKVLLLNGHMDVVPPGEGWSFEPFGGEIKDGKIYGRGTSDMKSGIASMISAMLGLKRSGTPFNGEIIFTGVAEEETAGKFGTIYLLQHNIGANADFAIVSEPTSLKVELGNRGVRWIDILVRGESSHAGRPYLGTNAIYYAAKLSEAIQAMKFKNRNDAFEIPTPSISVTMISGGNKANIIPNRCELTADRRMLPGETTETIMAELQNVIDPILRQERKLQIEVKMNPDYFDPYLISEDEPIVQAVIKSYKQVMKKNPEIAGKAACTDASHLFNLRGIPTVLFGPGNETMSHKVDEYVEIENLVLSTEIFISLFHNLLGE